MTTATSRRVSMFYRISTFNPVSDFRTRFHEKDLRPRHRFVLCRFVLSTLARNMRLMLLACSLGLVASSCRQEEGSGESVSDLAPDSGDLSIDRNTEPSYEEVWMMRGWQGNMGMVLGLKDGEFHYWFISDVGPTIEWAKGTYSRSNTEIQLRVSHDPSLEDPPLPKQGAVLGRESVQTDRLYNKTWRIVREDDGVFLASTDDLANGRDSGRWLRAVDPKDFAKYFPNGGPFILHMNPQLEGQQAGVGQPATHSESDSEGHSR